MGGLKVRIVLRRMAAMLLAAAAFGAVSTASAEDVGELEVVHSWTSAGEAAALAVIVEEFEKAGGKWVDTAVAGIEAMQTLALNRILGGNPPGSVKYVAGPQMDNLVEAGMLRTLDDVAAEGRWSEVLPQAFLDAITREGHIYAVPVHNHGQNWMRYSKEVLAKSGVTEVPNNWDDFFAAMDKVKAAGYIPIAVAGQRWLEQVVFNNVLISAAGRDTYLSIFRDLDVEAVRSPEFRKAAEIFGRMRDYLDPGFPGRSWNNTFNLILTNQAAVQFIGDFVKGEILAAGQTPGVEVGCQLTMDGSTFIISGDTFVFPKIDDPRVRAAQDLLAKTIVAAETQVPFSRLKGSVPIRTDVDTSSLDQCAQAGIAVLSNPEAQVPTPEMLITPAMRGMMQDAISSFLNDSSMTVDEFIEEFAHAVEG